MQNAFLPLFAGGITVTEYMTPKRTSQGGQFRRVPMLGPRGENSKMVGDVHKKCNFLQREYNLAVGQWKANTVLPCNDSSTEVNPVARISLVQYRNKPCSKDFSCPVQEGPTRTHPQKICSPISHAFLGTQKGAKSREITEAC